MTWARFDDNFPQHPKIVGLSDQAFRLHVSAVCYANANLTDGIIHASQLPILLPGRPVAAIRKKAQELLEAGVWETAPDGCFAIHDFLIYNKPRSEVMAKRHARAKAGAKGAASRWHDRQNAPDPGPEPVPEDPDPDPYPEIPPVVPPQAGGASRAERARNGSRRLRDVTALREGQTVEERYLGRRA